MIKYSDMSKYVYPELAKAQRRAKELGLPKPLSSTRQNKKLMIEYKDTIIHFGSRYESDYLIHGDLARRKRYRARASKILLKDGSPAYRSKSQPAYYSYNILW